jgi:hypothetical protein
MRGSAVYKPEVKKQMNPWWRGIGCLLVVFVFAISFAVSLWLITTLTSPDNPIQLPQQLAFVPSALRGMRSQFRTQFPWFGIYDYMVPTFVALVMSVLFYGVISMIYAMFRGDISDPRDARDYQPNVRRKRNVRRCR